MVKIFLFSNKILLLFSVIYLVVAENIFLTCFVLVKVLSQNLKDFSIGFGFLFF